MKALIEHWELIPTVHGNYCLHGTVQGHPQFKDGERIYTSAVVSAHAETESVFTYSGSHYKLGAPSTVYDSHVPDIKQALFKGLLKGIEVY